MPYDLTLPAIPEEEAVTVNNAAAEKTIPSLKVIIEEIHTAYFEKLKCYSVEEQAQLWDRILKRADAQVQYWVSKKRLFVTDDLRFLLQETFQQALLELQQSKMLEDLKASKQRIEMLYSEALSPYSAEDQIALWIRTLDVLTAQLKHWQNIKYYPAHLDALFFDNLQKVFEMQLQQLYASKIQMLQQALSSLPQTSPPSHATRKKRKTFSSAEEKPMAEEETQPPLQLSPESLQKCIQDITARHAEMLKEYDVTQLWNFTMENIGEKLEKTQKQIKDEKSFEAFLEKIFLGELSLLQKGKKKALQKNKEQVLPKKPVFSLEKAREAIEEKYPNVLKTREILWENTLTKHTALLQRRELNSDIKIQVLVQTFGEKLSHAIRAEEAAIANITSDPNPASLAQSESELSPAGTNQHYAHFFPGAGGEANAGPPLQSTNTPRV